MKVSPSVLVTVTFKNLLSVVLVNVLASNTALKGALVSDIEAAAPP